MIRITMKRPLIAVAALVLLAVPASAERRRSSQPPQFPPCHMVTGTAGVTFTRDRGQTLAPTAERLTGVKYTYGLVALDQPNKLMAWHASDLIASDDAGCSWRVVATFDDFDFPPSLLAAKGGIVYAWSENRQFLVRYDSKGAIKLKQPVPFVGLGVNPDDPAHLRGGGDDGSLWESHDFGTTWEYLNSLRLSPQPIFYRFEFDRADLDHIVAGMTLGGAYYTYDGGRNWRQSTFTGATGAVNAFRFAMSPLDPDVVWAMAIDLKESDANVPSHGRHIYLSRDGGATFVPRVDESAEVELVNGPTMAADPRNANVVWFVFGTHIYDYGTDLYRYDAATHQLTTAHNQHHDVNAIAFSPADPSVMYLGLERQEISR